MISRFLTILIHISAGYLLISSFKHLKDERNIVNSTIPLYLSISLNLAVYCYFNRQHLYKMVILNELVVVVVIVIVMHYRYV